MFKDAGRAGRRVVRSVYEICAFQALRERLRCKQIRVVGADKWRNPDDDLPADFETHRDAHYAAPSFSQLAEGDTETIVVNAGQQLVYPGGGQAGG